VADAGKMPALLGIALASAAAKENRRIATIFFRNALRPALAYDKKSNSAVAGEPDDIGQLFPRAAVPAVERSP